jgi:hypothetical protein
MLIPFTVYVEVTAVALGTACVGLSVDEPLPDKFSNIPGKTIGLININLVGTNIPFGPTTVNVNVGTGDHYVILGIQFPSPSFSSYRLKLQGVGTVVDRTFGLAEPVQYVYIAFNVGKDGRTSIISTGVIAPGGSPIANPGGGSLFGGDIGEAMAKVMSSMMEMMIPLMTISMTMNLMVGMIYSLMQGFGAVGA